MKKRLLLIILISIALNLGGLSFQIDDLIQHARNILITDKVTEDSPPSNNDTTTPPLPTKPNYVDITIASVGDILIHNTVYMAASNPQTNSYDFSSQFKYVKPYLEDADITIANLETTLAGQDRGYSGYPEFNTPDSIMDALKDAGVDIVTAANNHRMDKGISGFYRTIEVSREKGLDIIGVKAKEEEKTYVLKDIKGVKVAFLNFGYSGSLADGSLSINGLILPKDMANLMDGFDPEDLDSTVEMMGNKIKEARSAGAQVIVVCLHWGNEYHRSPNPFQQELAEKLVELGVDMIFGGHPHVLQPAVYLPSSYGGGGAVPVFYSQGNFISDQRKETVDDIYTEQGIIAKVTIRVYCDDCPRILDAEAIPTWVNKKRINNRLVYEVIPVDEALANNEKFPLLTKEDMERIKYCQDTVKHLSVDLE
ncbi:MAG: capsule biosynthesis protein CapA [Gracilibacter sp. BRH_c7a]|nr:MAG: capsule biosynthesis protein CapA [Gracilibacter sp. BRH_c7a]